jgi:hypothetical protein
MTAMDVPWREITRADVRALQPIAVLNLRGRAAVRQVLQTQAAA